MKLHEVHLKPEARKRYRNQRTLTGYVSRWDVENECFYLLRPDQPGMLGRDGDKIPFADVTAVYKEEDDRPGVFADTDQVRLARQHYTQYGRQYAR